MGAPVLLQLEIGGGSEGNTFDHRSLVSFFLLFVSDGSWEATSVPTFFPLSESCFASHYLICSPDFSNRAWLASCHSHSPFNH